MTVPLPARSIVLCLCAVLTAVPCRAGQQAVVDRISEAKGLYESADYDEALIALDRLDSAAATRDEARSGAVYRALCLLALGRQGEAEATIEQLVGVEPLFRIGTEMPPRLHAIVDSVRARLRPALVQQHYASGKARFDGQDHAGALEEFTVVVALIDESRDEPALRDMKTLALGFGDLSRRAIASIAAPARSTAAAPEPSPAKAQLPTAPPEAPARTLPPIAISQSLPPVPLALSRIGATGQAGTGVIEVLVSEQGAVVSAKLVDHVHPFYDEILLAAAKQWTYKPATRNGKPVQFVKRIAVNLALKP